ncbi:hypothetical protein KIN20_017255 [Parelaphostrongylus tenuis]|uniref:Uncharacterized protein n=1 Tax=Parelaphostrongylus tenuis TaxID=148309 RepID=A0AAD5QQK8_PARTN|nr:hypothetical protein KIN20_017255 [Parelaphostrongylus tenuis]
MSICDDLRCDIKHKLRRKFDNLLRERNSSLNSGSKSRRNPTSGKFEGESEIKHAPKPSRVTILGGITLTDSAKSLSELGPSFSPAQSLSKTSLRAIACNLHEVLDQLRYKTKQEKLGLAQRREAKHYHHLLFHERSSNNNNLIAKLTQSSIHFQTNSSTYLIATEKANSVPT